MTLQYLERPGQPRLAYHRTEATATGQNLPGVMFLGGFLSDMTGTKATWLENKCVARGQSYVRFDYSGHGISDGDFNDGALSRWRDDALAILDQLTAGPFILAGSSMGGWIALLMAQMRPERIVGLVGIAAAPDFTKDIRQSLPPQQQALILQQGFVTLPSKYRPEPYRLTRAFLDDGDALCLLDHDNHFAMPLRLIQGMQDHDLPWQTAFRLKNAIVDGDVVVTLIEGGDHRLSRPEDLERIDAAIEELSAKAAISAYK